MSVSQFTKDFMEHFNEYLLPRERSIIADVEKLQEEDQRHQSALELVTSALDVLDKLNLDKRISKLEVKLELFINLVQNQIGYEVPSRKQTLSEFLDARVEKIAEGIK